MGIFSSVSKESKQAIGLLSVGTFLEFFDLCLYMHMTLLLNELFFPKGNAHTQALLAAFGFSITFAFRPIGALLFGYIGDTYGRKVTVVITTFMMATTCLTMACVPTYAQIGMAAAWIMTLCRIVQGMSSMGEIIGAELYLTEALALPGRYPAVGLIHVFADLGGVAALGIATLATAQGFNWRIAFLVGAGVALVGSVARTALRESPEFADARRRLKNIAKRTGEDTKHIEKLPVYQEKVNKKTAWSYFFIQNSAPAFFYFVFVLCGQILGNTFGYEPHQVILHNFLLMVFILLVRNIPRTYLSAKIYPLRILQVGLAVTYVIVLALPFVLNNLQSALQLFILQVLIYTFIPDDLPAVPIFLRHFPIFKRFTYTASLYALARALVYVITSFGLTYLIEYLGYWGLWVIMVPVLVGYSYGINHFKKLDIATGRYAQEMSIRAEVLKKRAKPFSGPSTA